jgi:cytoskeletal protein RodZ
VTEQLGGPPSGEDEFDRRLRELTEEISGTARIREPSAAERAKAAKKRKVKRRGGGRVAGWSVAAVVLAGAGFLAWHQVSKSNVGGPNDTQVVTNGPVPTSAPATSASPTSAASAGAQLLAGPPADPFADTAADQWADGAAGITVPGAVSHGPFTASEVAAAYATTRSLLIAQNLDPTTLRGGAPTAFADVLSAQQRSQFIAGLDNTGLNKQGVGLSTRNLVASFAPGTTAFIGTVIKVHGSMSARSATDQGNTVLDIDVNYRFVYAVEPPHAPADWMRIVGQVTGYVEFENWQDPGGPLQPWDISAFPAESGAQCGTTDGYHHPDYPGGPPLKVQPSGAPINPYSMDNQPPTGCQSTTGT